MSLLSVANEAANRANKLRSTKNGDSSKNIEKLETITTQLPLLLNNINENLDYSASIKDDLIIKIKELETLLLLYEQIHYKTSSEKSYSHNLLKETVNLVDNDKAFAVLANDIVNVQTKFDILNKYYTNRYLQTIQRNKNKSK